MFRNKLFFVMLMLFLALGSALGVSAQQDITSSNEPGLSAYTCAFNAELGVAQIRASLFDETGGSVPLDGANVSVSRVGASAPLTPENAVSSPSETRPPLRVIIVLDVTDTMPLDGVIDTLINTFLLTLAVEDEVALVTAGSSVTDPTQFYVDKGTLANDHLFDLTVQQGDNLINDGILRALSATQPNSPARQVVLVIADSAPQVQQASNEEIITRAQASQTQIIPIALHTQAGSPDDETLFSLAEATSSFGFAYDGDKRVGEIQSGLQTIFGRILALMNNEIVINTNLADQTPDETGFIPFDVSVDLGNGTTLTDRVSCPPPPVASADPSIPVLPTFAIAFTNIVDGLNVNAPVLVEVGVQPFDALPLDAQFRFILDDEQAQDGPEPSFNFNPQALDPGRHTLRVQLRDVAGEVLATTPTTTVFTQRELALTAASGVTTNVSGPLTIVVANGSANMAGVQLRAAEANAPDITYPIGSAQFANGTASFEIADIQAEAGRLFPQQGDTPQGWNLLITAISGGATPEDPPLGTTRVPLVLSVAAPQPFSLDSLAQGPAAPIAAIVVALVLNGVLFSLGKKAAMKRTIAAADKRDLPQQLMCVTVSRGGAGRQTHMLTKKTTLVGRGSGNDIQLEDDANVSRQHGAIIWRGGKWYFANRKDKLKTKVNGKAYKGMMMAKLDDPTDVEMGSYQLVFHSAEQQKRDLADLVKTNL
jgi:hypothetical protein